MQRLCNQLALAEMKGMVSCNSKDVKKTRKASIPMVEMREIDYHLPLGKMNTVKKVIDFPVPSRDLTYQTLPGRE
jgi:hypothetical protein